ncbi:MAG: dephospho-CoA kinase/protein folding accessory protein, partial [Gammaproteobacteria bacterium]|nr:dephospho-CoA kinase/protein folding accessory protein [Gammaproteobacteria bacterium]
GSTSVRGLAAKPVIDMTVVVPAAAAMRTVIDRLAMIGYRHRGDLGVTGREAFARPEGTPDHHLYACVAGMDALRNHLAVRDYLRGSPSAARAYGALKKQLAARFAGDIDGYVDGKTDFILAILAGAGFLPEQIAMIRAINSKPNEAG